MKVRQGFVSNSSSASFIVDLDIYDSTIDLAKTMLQVIIDDEDGNLFEDDIEFFQRLLNTLEAAEQSGLEPDTPIMFPTMNFETFIVKKEEGYYVDTDFGFDWEDFMDGIGEMSFETDYDLSQAGKPFYIVEYDIIGEILRLDEVPCKTKDHNAYYEAVKLKNGDIVCLECEKEKIKEFKISKD